ncbi:BTB/POZ domain-containing protein At5g60050 [Nymphaea colorata]|nr:BTB/POZ domain-containing protein At5g60050 [Nymphaea colorata]
MAEDRSQRSKEISAMIKQGFISDPSLSPFKAARVSPPATTLDHHRPSSPTAVLAAKSSPPPPAYLAERSNCSPTLLEMMAGEKDTCPPESQRRIRERVERILKGWDLPESGDVKLTLSSRDGFRITVNVHRRILTGCSQFFASKLRRQGVVDHEIEISECDNVEAYLETVALMYCKDLRRRLIKEDVSMILGVLKVSSAIMFDAGILSCLECLEAMPWSEEEEEKVVSTLNQLDLQYSTAEVLQRVSLEPSTSENPDGIFLQLLEGILCAKDDRSRREMKSLLSVLLKGHLTHGDGSDGNGVNVNKVEINKEILYHICDKCINALLQHCMTATIVEDSGQDRGALMSEIAREADNLHWVVDILIDKKVCDEFVKLWADCSELTTLHSRIPVMYRYEISRITAQLCVAIGRGQVLVSKNLRISLLETWLEALYEDFGWMKRACKTLDKKSMEDGLGQMILTLPLAQQQSLFLKWFDRFLNRGDDCPNIQRAFEVWWRRAFVRRYISEDRSQSQLALYNS